MVDVIIELIILQSTEIERFLLQITLTVKSCQHALRILTVPDERLVSITSVRSLHVETVSSIKQANNVIVMKTYECEKHVGFHEHRKHVF